MPKKNLLLIVLSQFACTSIWFAINAVMPDLASNYGIAVSNVGTLTSVIQFGFITGTLTFALLGLADKYDPTKLFMIAALSSGIINLALLFPFNNYTTVIVWRFLNGVCLAGIYPIGIKIAADLYTKELPKVLSLLVGTLVLGTALPHLISYFTIADSLRSVVLSTSVLSIMGGLGIGLGVHLPKLKNSGITFNSKEIPIVFKEKKLQKTAFAYFGHMWELYTFWALLPLLFSYYNILQGARLSVSLSSFYSIAIGFVGCYLGAYTVKYTGSKLLARISLAGSAICCLLLPLAVLAPPTYFLLFMSFWGMLVIMDSPQLSALVAQTAPVAYKGTAITLINCIGFALTIVSLQLSNFLLEKFGVVYALFLLAIGPLLGALKLNYLKK